MHFSVKEIKLYLLIRSDIKKTKYALPNPLQFFLLYDLSNGVKLREGAQCTERRDFCIHFHVSETVCIVSATCIYTEVRA